MTGSESDRREWVKRRAAIRRCPACSSEVLDTRTIKGEQFLVDPYIGKEEAGQPEIHEANVKIDFSHLPPRATPARPVDGEDRYRAHRCPHRPTNNVELGVLLLAEKAYEISRERSLVGPRSPAWRDLGRVERAVWIERVGLEMEKKAKRRHALDYFSRMFYRLLGRKPG